MPERNERTQRIADTIIGGTTDRSVINTAVTSYLAGLEDFGFSRSWESILGIQNIQDQLHTIYTSRVESIKDFVSDIIFDINERISLWESKEYRDLFQLDQSLWNKDNEQIEFSLFACVDKGIPFEAVIGVGESNQINRTLGGDIQIFYSPSRKTFYQDYSPLKKGIIHQRRVIEGADVIVLMEHSGCGRRIQIIGNEEEKNEIPSMSVVFDNIGALQSEFGISDEVRQKLHHIQQLWESYERKGPEVITPDNGLYAGIVYKIAQRIALKNTTNNEKTIVPIVMYDKMNGNMYSGLDNLNVLTDPFVLAEGGFTNAAIQKLVQEGKIFSLKEHNDELELIIETISSGILPDKRTYEDLQNDWVSVQTELVRITEMLWEGYSQNSSKGKLLKKIADQYLKFAIPAESYNVNSPVEIEIAKRRLLHQLFHVYAYAFHLDSFKKGNQPGHHIETHLATGNHDLGSRRNLPLGQGFLSRPTSPEMFTGKVVLHHSYPGKEEIPISVMIKCDTDKEMDEPISNPESRVTLDDLQTFFELWPYFLVGDMIPFVVIKQNDGGISRLAKSIVLTFDDIALLLERSDVPLPRFVPAETKKGKVILVPAREVLFAGVNTNTLGEFRKQMIEVANNHDNDEDQKAYKLANNTK